MATVSIVMGSISDKDIVVKAYEFLTEMGVDTSMTVLSAHRTPEEVLSLAKNAEKDGVKVIIAAAGKAAHLAGFIAGSTTLPVIGLPIKSSTMDGLDSLLSVVQMPNGVPVATVAINGGLNAGILAVQMLALSDSALMDKLKAYKVKMHDEVIASSSKL